MPDRHEQAIGKRRTMDRHRTIAAAKATQAEGRSAPLTGIIFVFKSGIPWEMGCDSGVTCWRRLRDWHRAGVWERLHRVLLDRLGIADEIDWSRASLDSRLVPAKRGAKLPARIRRIAARRARSSICWWSGAVSRSRSA